MAAFNLLGLPATEIPLGLNQRGLPLGVQAAAARGHDHLSVAVAVELEREIANMGKKARDGKLTMEDMAGGSFTMYAP